MPRQTKEFMQSEEVKEKRKQAIEKWKQDGGLELSRQRRQESIANAKLSLPDEEWKLFHIDKVNRDVLVSNMGRIKSLSRVPCIFTPYPGVYGLKVKINSHKFLIHHLVAKAWLNWQGQSLHFKDGNRLNPKLSNLEIPEKKRKAKSYTNYTLPSNMYYRFEVYVAENKTYYRSISVLLDDLGMAQTQYNRQKVVDVKLGKAPQQRLNFTPLKIEKSNKVVTFINDYCNTAVTTGLPGIKMHMKALEVAKTKMAWATYNIANESITETPSGAIYKFDLDGTSYEAYLQFQIALTWTKVRQI